MTRDEREKTIKILQWLHDNTFLFRSTEEDVKYATENAIRALEPSYDRVNSDLISRWDLLDAFDLSDNTRKYGGDGRSGYRTLMLYEIQDIIEEMPSYSEMPNKWIPVSERLPEKSDEFLVTVVDKEDKDYRFVGIAWFAHPKDYDIKEGEWRELGINEVVVAWCKLPEPYKDGGE